MFSKPMHTYTLPTIRGSPESEKIIKIMRKSTFGENILDI